MLRKRYPHHSVQHLRDTADEDATAFFTNQYVLGHSDTSTSHHRNLSSLKHFGLVLLCILVLIMILGNLLSIVTILSSRTLRQYPSYNHVLSLATVDLCMSVIIMPLYVVWEYYYVWPFGEVSCKIITSLDIAFSDISIYTVVVIAIDKYVLISRPLRYHSWMTITWSRIMITIVWCISMAFGFISVYSNIAWEYNNDRNVLAACVFIMKDTYNYITAIFIFIIPFSFLIYSGTRIYFIARRHMTQISQQQSLQTTPSHTSVSVPLHRTMSLSENGTPVSAEQADQRKVNFTFPVHPAESHVRFSPRPLRHTVSLSQALSPNRHSAGSLSSEIYRRRRVSLLKPFGTVVIVIFFMVVMCGPYWIATCADTFCNCIEPWIYEDVLAVIYNLNSLVNPFIYILTDRKYRVCAKKLLKKLLCFKNQ